MLNVRFELLFGFGVYLAAVAAIGALAWRATQDANDFMLGRRRLPYWVAALSAGASDMSGWLLLGLPGLAYAAVSEAALVALGLFIGTYLNWRFIAERLRRETALHGDALTLPEYFERRFDDPGHMLRRLTALCILVFFVFYTAAGFVAGGKLFATAFPIDYPDAVTLGAVLIVVYTVFGGFLAVAWTDALQATLMFGALTFVAAIALGTPTTDPAGVRIAPSLNALSAMSVTSALAWGLGYCGQPHILTRFMALRDPASAVPARRLATAWTGIALIAAIIVGLGGHWVLDPAMLAFDRETVFIRLLDALLHPVVAGICLAAILAAIMSTADSQLLVAAAALTHDLLPRRQGRRMRGLAWHRAAVCCVCIVAWHLALSAQAGVLKLVATAWAGFGASLGPAVIMSLYAPAAPRTGILAGIGVGAATVAVWEQRDSGIFAVYSLLPGFACGLAVMLIATALHRGTRTGSGTRQVT